MEFGAGETPKEFGGTGQPVAGGTEAFGGMVHDTIMSVSAESAVGHVPTEAAQAAGDLAVTGDGTERPDSVEARWGRNQPRAILQRLADVGFDADHMLGGDVETERRVFDLLQTDKKAVDISAETGVDPTVITKMTHRWVRRAQRYTAEHGMPEEVPVDLFQPTGRPLERTVGDETSVSAQLRGALRQSGLSAREVAHELGISETYVSRMLNGLRTPTRQFIDRLYQHDPETARHLHIYLRAQRSEQAPSQNDQDTGT